MGSSSFVLPPVYNQGPAIRLPPIHSLDLPTTTPAKVAPAAPANVVYPSQSYPVAAPQPVYYQPQLQQQPQLQPGVPQLSVLPQVHQPQLLQYQIVGMPKPPVGPVAAPVPGLLLVVPSVSRNYSTCSSSSVMSPVGSPDSRCPSVATTSSQFSTPNGSSYDGLNKLASAVNYSNTTPRIRSLSDPHQQQVMVVPVGAAPEIKLEHGSTSPSSPSPLEGSTTPSSPEMEMPEQGTVDANDHHMAHHGGIKKSSWKPRKKRQCPECKLYFSNLVTHKSTHLKPTSRPHICQYCQRGFARPNDLFRHVKCHWKEIGLDKGQFKCPYKNHSSGDHCCHNLGIFSRCDTFKNHLKAIHFQYPNGTKKDQRNKVNGHCRMCHQFFNNVDEWLANHVEKNQCPFANELKKES